MIPTPIVCFMSLIANLPKGGYSLKVSQTRGLVGTILTMAQSPDLMAYGSSSRTLPFLLSIFCIIFSNLQAIWAVWQSKTGVYPLAICPGCLITITWALKYSHILAGSFLLSDTTYPLLTSLTVTPLTLNPTLSPG